MFSSAIASQTKRAIASLLLSVHLIGCSTHYVPVTTPVPETVRAHPKAPLRVTLHDGRQVQVHEPRVTTDSLVGLRMTARATTGAMGVERTTTETDRVAVALADIASVELGKRHLSTGGAIALIVVVVALVAAAVAFNNSMDEWSMGGG